MFFLGRDSGRSSGRGGGPGPRRRRRGPLDPGVHVRLVVVADVDDVLVALRRPRQRLDADVEGAAVARPGHHRGVLALDVLGRLDARGGHRRGLEGGVEHGDLQGVHREGPVDDRPAAGGDHHHRVGAQRLQGEAHGQRPAAALAAQVPGVDLLADGDVPLHRAASGSSGSRGRTTASGRAGPMGSPLTPTYRQRSGCSRAMRSSTTSMHRLHPDVAAADAQDVPVHVGGRRPQRQSGADLLGEDPRVARAHVAVEHRHLGPAAQVAAHLLEGEGAEGHQAQQAHLDAPLPQQAHGVADVGGHRPRRHHARSRHRRAGRAPPGRRGSRRTSPNSSPASASSRPARSMCSNILKRIS